MQMTIKDERRLDYSEINITLTKDDMSDLLRYGFVRMNLEGKWVYIKLEK